MVNSKLPKCGTCEPTCPYQPRCQIPYAAEPSTDGMYINFGNGGKYCKSVFYSNRYTTVVNSLYNISGTFGVNEGVPVAVWDDVTQTAYTQYPVPYYLQGQDGNTQNSQVIYLTSLFDGPNPQTTVAAPILGEDSKTTVVGDTSDLFIKGVFPIFPVSAAVGDVDDVYTQFHIVTNGLIDLAVKVGATKVAGRTDMFTEVVEVLDVANLYCKVPLCVKTFRLMPLGVVPATDPPVYMSFVKNACKEFSVGLLHGKAGTFEAGQTFPDADSDTTFEWVSYRMVGAKGHGCPMSSPEKTTADMATTLFSNVFATASTLEDSTVATLGLSTVGTTPAPVTPGDLTTAQQNTMVGESSNSLVKMWATGVDTFNAFLLALAL